ncbi:MAG: hypothetical protein Q8O91_10220, partial [Candidatus Aminicenantes bacterium]|nr:hypothetical protein [Candidatus Aminicenantes bacterium]
MRCRRGIRDPYLGRCYARDDAYEKQGRPNSPVKGRAFAAEVDPRAMPGALTRDVNTRLSTAETDPQTKPGAPAAAPAA